MASEIEMGNAPWYVKVLLLVWSREGFFGALTLILSGMLGWSGYVHSRYAATNTELNRQMASQHGEILENQKKILTHEESIIKLKSAADEREKQMQLNDDKLITALQSLAKDEGSFAASISTMETTQARMLERIYDLIAQEQREPRAAAAPAAPSASNAALRKEIEKLRAHIYSLQSQIDGEAAARNQKEAGH